MSTPKYPQVKVKLVGEDGNAFAILGRVQRASGAPCGLERRETDASEFDAWTLQRL